MRSILLTIDDGPTTSTHRILDLAAENDCGIVFFVIGKRLKEHEEVCKRIIEDGHVLANHTWNHPIGKRARDRGRWYYRQEIRRTQIEIERLYQKYGNGVFEKKWFRFPALLDAPLELKRTLDRNGFVDPFFGKPYWEKVDINLRDGPPADGKRSCLTREEIEAIVQRRVAEPHFEPHKKPLVILAHDVVDQVEAGMFDLLFCAIKQRTELRLLTKAQIQKRL